MKNSQVLPVKLETLLEAKNPLQSYRNLLFSLSSETWPSCRVGRNATELQSLFFHTFSYMIRVLSRSLIRYASLVRLGPSRRKDALALLRDYRSVFSKNITIHCSAHCGLFRRSCTAASSDDSVNLLVFAVVFAALAQGLDFHPLRLLMKPAVLS